MNKAGDSFVAEDFLRLGRGDVALWALASVIVVSALAGGVWAYQALVPAPVVAGPPPGAMVIEFAELAVSPAKEDLAVPEGEPSAASEAIPPSAAEADPDAEPIEDIVPEAEPEEIVEAAEAKAEPPLAQEAPAEPEIQPEPAEPIIDAPQAEVPEPPVVIQQRVAPAPPEPEPVPEEPATEPVDPNLPVPVTMSARIAETRANTPATRFTPPPRRAPPPQAASQASAPKPQAQQAEQAAAPQQSTSSEPSASVVNRWESSVLRHLGQRRKYPADARQRGEEGRVVVQFTIDAAGNVQSVSIARSSGFAALDQAARDLVAASSPVPRPPEGLPRSRLTIAMPVDYER